MHYFRTEILSDGSRVRIAQGKPGKRDFLEKIRENLENSGNSLTIFTISGKTPGILFCQTSLIK